MRMLPLPQPRPKVLIGGYVDRVLKRVATRGDGWITYFYTAESFSQAWAKIRDFAEEAGRDPDELSNVAQLPLCIADSYEEADRLVRRYVDDYFDMAPWSESTADSAIRGTPEQCAEQLAAQLEAGVQHAVFAPSTTGSNRSSGSRPRCGRCCRAHPRGACDDGHDIPRSARRPRTPCATGAGQDVHGR
ncbi:LLM class flavin-dependent oxidoreductase [Saccharopolyspora spinosporotrichia]